MTSPLTKRTLSIITYRCSVSFNQKMNPLYMKKDETELPSQPSHDTMLLCIPPNPNPTLITIQAVASIDSFNKPCLN